VNVLSTPLTGVWQPEGLRQTHEHRAGRVDERVRPAPPDEERRRKHMSVIKVNVPPDQTPEEEAALVASIAASYRESTGSSDVTVEVNRPEEVDYRSVQAQASSRWG
jgi:hypothetical protein